MRFSASNRFQVTLHTYNEKERLGQHRLDKMAAAGLSLEFVRRIEAGVDLASQLPRYFLKDGGKINHLDRANDEQINVAAGRFRAAGHRTINGRDINLRAERRQPVAEDIDHTGRFYQEGAQFRKYRAFLAGLKIRAVPAPRHFEDARRRKFCQVALQGGRPDTQALGQFHRINRLARIQQQGCQQPLSGSGKKRIGYGDVTHYA